MSLLNDILSLKYLADSLCNTQCKTGVLATHCGELKVCLESILRDLHDQKPLCIDTVYDQISAQMGRLQAAVVLERQSLEIKREKDNKRPTIQSSTGVRPSTTTDVTQISQSLAPSPSTFSLRVLFKQYGKWQQELAEHQVALSQLGLSAEPQVANSKFAFSKLAGADNEKQQLREGLVYPFKFSRLYPERVTGVLLYGLPGTGKTILVKGLLHEMGSNGVALFPDPASLKGKYEGETEARIQALYASASATLNATSRYDATSGEMVAPPRFVLIFIDEADSLLGTGRESDASKQRTVNTFLQLLDGVKTDPRITTIAATNHPNAIDSAIMRRLPLKIEVHLPTRQAREFVIREELARQYNFPNVQYDDIHVRHGTVVGGGAYMENIAKYGRQPVTSATNPADFSTIGVRTRRQRGTDVVVVDSYLTAEDIYELSVRTGPHSKHRDGKLKGRGNHDDRREEFSDTAFENAAYGFSLADLRSAMKQAFRFANHDVLADDAKFISIDRTSIDVQKLDATSTGTTMPLQQTMTRQAIKKWYIYNPNEQYIGAEIPQPASKRVRYRHPSAMISFDIRRSHIEAALLAATSSIRESDYVEIHEFARGKASLAE